MDGREGLCPRFSFSHLLSRQFATSNVSDSDPNAMETGPPTNNITAPPTSGGLGMILAGLASVGRRATQNVGTMTIGGGSVDSFDSGGHKTTFSSGGSLTEEGKGGGWWPFGGKS